MAGLSSDSITTLSISKHFSGSDKGASGRSRAVMRPEAVCPEAFSAANRVESNPLTLASKQDERNDGRRVRRPLTDEEPARRPRPSVADGRRGTWLPHWRVSVRAISDACGGRTSTLKRVPSRSGTARPSVRTSSPCTVSWPTSWPIGWRNARPCPKPRSSRPSSPT